jgi:hypothetical protein
MSSAKESGVRLERCGEAGDIRLEIETGPRQREFWQEIGTRMLGRRVD